MRAVITGAANGIGRATAKNLASQGFDLALLDRDAAGLDTLAAEIQAMDRRADRFCLDLLDREAIDETFAAIGPVDALINNVGQSARERASDFHVSDPAVWDFVIAINLTTTMYCARQVVGGMRERRQGRIVNVASNVHHRGPARMSEYAAAKAGVVGFTRSLATELAPFNVTVNAVSPGPIETGAVAQVPPDIYRKSVAAVPMGRFGTADEVAAAIVFLCGPSSSYVTGQEILVNGGSAY